MGYLPLLFSEYLDYTRDTECAPIFNLWCAISAVGALAEPKVWVWYGAKSVYLHQYICLVAPSGHRKSESIDQLLRILNKLEGVPFAPDRLTERSIMDALARNTKTDVQIQGQARTINYCSMYVIAPEFASLFETRNMNVLTFLTRIYDSKEGIWSYVTSHFGEVHIERPSVSILAGSTPEWLSEMLPHSAVGGGFTNRFHFIYNNSPITRTPFPQADPSNTKLERRCLSYFQAVQNTSGEIQWKPEAKDYFVDWYKTLPEPNYASISKGWEARLPFFLLQLAGISVLASMRKPLYITKDDIDFSIECLNPIKDFITQAFNAFGRNPLASVQERLIGALEQAGQKGLLRSEIYYAFTRDCTPIELRSILGELLTSGIIEIHRTNAGILYRLTNKAKARRSRAKAELLPSFLKEGKK